MLATPLGLIHIYVDDCLMPYEYKLIPVNKYCPDLNGRYMITINYVPDGREHSISCVIDGYSESPDDFIEPDERTEINSFCSKGVKLSIGVKGDVDCIEYEQTSEFDYDTKYLKNGIQYLILPFTKIIQYVFVIAWMNNVTDTNEIQTWDGANPYFIGVSPFLCPTDSSGVGTKIFFRIDIDHPSTGRGSAGILTKTLPMVF